MKKDLFGLVQGRAGVRREHQDTQKQLERDSVLCFHLASHRDVVRATVVTSLISVLGSWLLTASLMSMMSGVEADDWVVAFTVCTLVPLAVAPLVSYKSFNLMRELVRSRREIERLSQTDDLTQAYNRRHFMTMAQRELASAIRNGYPVSLLLLDLDDFKQINDRLGHLTGDRALAACAAAIRAAIRQGDMLGRFGGDEFLVLSPHTDLDSVVHLAGRIHAMLAGAGLVVKGETIRMRVSVGAASTEQGLFEAEELLRRADRALYRAKEKGGDCTELAV
jgi:diguanylate cyclase (GGDEF)-like protein